jgi:hypothetical protein
LASIHKVIAADVKALEDIGYALASVDGSTLDVFINDLFPNFDILSLLREVEKNFTPATTRKINRNITFDYAKKEFLIDYNNAAGFEDIALFFVREFSKKRGMITVEHHLCILPKAARGKGLIKPVFQESLNQYLNCGMSRILVHAALSGGGYTWAKHGFRAVNKGEVDLILIAAHGSLSVADFAVCEKVYKGYYTKNPNGRAFPMHLWAALDFMKPILMGSNWHGELNLKRAGHLKKFREYVYR